jgi:enoyl-CoA hydratase/carnithine racemase
MNGYYLGSKPWINAVNGNAAVIGRVLAMAVT